MALLFVLAACLLGTMALAARQYLTVSEVADVLGDSELTGYFHVAEALPETVTDGEYQATLLGAVLGNDMCVYRNLRKTKGKIYAVIAISRTDGVPMPLDDRILVSPLIEGYSPLEYHVYTMNASCSYRLIDGILYEIVSTNHMDAFSDRRVYIAETDGAVPDSDQYYFDEMTGAITVNETYAGTNILFTLPQE